MLTCELWNHEYDEILNFSVWGLGAVRARCLSSFECVRVFWTHCARLRAFGRTEMPEWTLFTRVFATFVLVEALLTRIASLAIWTSAECAGRARCARRSSFVQRG